MQGILNFAPIRLNVPPEVPVEDVNLVMELVTGGELFDRIVARGNYTEKVAQQPWPSP